MTYDLSTEQVADLKNRFTYHAPHSDQTEKYVAIREDALKLALLIAQFTPVSREQSVALSSLEQCIFFANAAIARHEPAPYGITD
jgi:hypothetical protein